MSDYPTLLFDCDDVLLDLGPFWVGFLNAVHRTNVRYEDIDEWDMTKFFPRLSRQEIYGPLFASGFWGRVPPVPGATEYMTRLHDNGYNMYIVTATNLATSAEKSARLIELFPFIDEDHIIVAQKKQMVRGHILVDDAPHNLEGGEYIKLLFTRPHNKAYSSYRQNSIIRVNTWKEIYDTITRIYPKGVPQH